MKHLNIYSSPKVSGGEPIITQAAAPVTALLDRIDAGDSVEEVAKDFSCDPGSLELLVELRGVLTKEIAAEREEWRAKAAHRLNEWRLRDEDAKEAEHDRDEAVAAKEMWRSRLLSRMGTVPDIPCGDYLGVVADRLEADAEQMTDVARNAADEGVWQFESGRIRGHREAADLLRRTGQLGELP